MRALALALAATVAGACAWSGPDEREQAVHVQEAVRETVAAYNGKDVERYLDGWTHRGFRRAFGVSKHEADLVPPSLNGLQSFEQSRARIDLFSRTSVTQNRASTTLTLTELYVVRTLRLSLVREQGRWRLDEAVDVAPPPSADAVEVDLTEYTIRADATASPSTTFRVRNTGTLPHELLLLRLRPSGREDSLGRIERIQPGATKTLVTRGLPPGRYALVCNLPAADGSPHSSRGMRALLAVSSSNAIGRS